MTPQTTPPSQCEEGAAYNEMAVANPARTAVDESVASSLSHMLFWVSRIEAISCFLLSSARLISDHSLGCCFAGGSALFSVDQSSPRPCLAGGVSWNSTGLFVIGDPPSASSGGAGDDTVTLGRRFPCSQFGVRTLPPGPGPRHGAPSGGPVFGACRLGLGAGGGAGGGFGRADPSSHVSAGPPLDPRATRCTAVSIRAPAKMVGSERKVRVCVGVWGQKAACDRRTWGASGQGAEESLANGEASTLMALSDTSSVSSALWPRKRACTARAPASPMLQARRFNSATGAFGRAQKG